MLNYNDEESSEWIIEGIIQPKKVGIIAGSAGTLKSWTSLNMAFSVALGLPFVKNFPTKITGGSSLLNKANELPGTKREINLLSNRLNKLFPTSFNKK